MNLLSGCFTACSKEADIVRCLNEELVRRKTNGYLPSETFNSILELLIDKLKTHSFDGVTLFTEMWNTYERNFHVMASFLIPVYMEYLNPEQEMILYAALNTIEDSDLAMPFAYNMSLAYNPNFDQWNLFLKKLSMSENEIIRYSHKILINLLKSSKKEKQMPHEFTIEDVKKRHSRLIK
ncbi:MAG: hypothetical protein D8M58_11510 [Calditrichaeota bacterium]|nr:MAG: hypothetical protein DWQ03_10885 [Calditrichota bacterium]MBL1206021.1 hypothetical protein [Calditrichota bacterium]NOG45849.1 hypothetical protein [Calditrichota bacterium]